jgi:hypothetical protein
MAWLYLVAAAAPGDVVCLNQLAIKIPLDVSPADRQHIKQMLLFSSSDEGRTWEQKSVIPASQDSFKFYAPKDGLYWFTIQVEGHDGKLNPEDVYKSQPSQKIMIDTVPPVLRIESAERNADEVIVSYSIEEDHPDMSSLRMEYRLADAATGAWYPVALEPKMSGKTHFRVNGSGAVSVRLHIQDLAKNQATAEKEVPAQAGGVTTASLNTSRAGGEPVVPARGTETADSLVIKNVAPPEGGSSSQVDPPGKSHEDLPLAPPTPGSQVSETGPGNGLGGTSTHVVATSERSAGGAASVSPSAGYHPRRGTLPPLQIVKNKEVTLEYTLKDVGPSGIGKVELWLTRDDGQNWVRYAEDQEVTALATNGRFQRTVELPGEGIFGINLVVFSKAGLGKPHPISGDAPQMRIEVDMTAPEAKLFNPVPHPKSRNILILSWQAHDPNHQELAKDPITLQWTERKGGMWQNIAANLANKGQYEWQLPPNLPDHVYLRLIVRDVAGNEGVAETPDAQLVDLSEPEGIILGVVSPANQ